MDDSPGRHGAGGGVLVDEIETNFHKLVRIIDTRETYPFDGDDNSNEEGSEELEPYGQGFVKPGLEKSAGSLPVEENDEPETALRLLFREGPVQPVVPLVSAMKGSREKLGVPPRKLTVSWAADVYDPIPNSLSHTVKTKQKKSRKDRDKENNANYKKNGKKGQKGNLRGGSKDKKQIRKGGGRSDRGYKSVNTCSSDLHEFDVGSPEGVDYCGSSFLKKSSTNFHYSVAEAL